MNTSKAIIVWRWDDAPKPYRAKSEPADEDTRPMTRYDPQMELIGQRAELERLRAVEALARELARYVLDSRVVMKVQKDKCYVFCHYCLKAELSEMFDNKMTHADDCLIPRATKLGLLSK